MNQEPHNIKYTQKHYSNKIKDLLKNYKKWYKFLKMPYLTIQGKRQ